MNLHLLYTDKFNIRAPMFLLRSHNMTIPVALRVVHSLVESC